MKKVDSIKWFLRIALVFFATMLFTTVVVAQTNRIGNPNDSDIYGEWVSLDGEHKLYMNYIPHQDPSTFVRISPDGIHSGSFFIQDKYLDITKAGDEWYRLLFYLDGLKLIVEKPESEISEGEAWIFQKVSNKQTQY